MNKLLKKILSSVLSLTMVVSVLFSVPLMARAINTPVECESTAVNFWADASNIITQNDIDAFVSGDKTAMVGAVGIFRRSTSNGSTNYLFLPSTADATRLKVWFTASRATVNGKEITSGEFTDVFSEVNDGGYENRKTYTVVLGNTSYELMVMKSGDVGTVYIDTASGSMSSIHSNKNNSESGTIMVVNSDGKIEYDGVLEKMSGRGNATWDYSKKPYNIKLADSTKLLGMSKGKKWCLLANHIDQTLVRNQLTYDFADYIGIKYQPHCKPVDLYVNQQYYGSYQLSEKVEIKSGRVDINDAYENLELANGTVDSETGIVTPADLSTVSTTRYTSRDTSKLSATNRTAYYIDDFVTSNANFEGGALVAAARRASFNSYYGNFTGNKKYTTSLNNPNDITGGYIYELEITERWIEDPAGFCGYNRQGWVIKSADTATKEMVNYSYDLLYALGSSVYNNGTVPSTATNQGDGARGGDTALLGTSNRGTTTNGNHAPAEQYRGKKWSDILDADSAVKFYWTQEFFKNLDSATSSTYFFKDSDSIDTMLYAGPVWDMDNTIKYDKNEARWGSSISSTDGWYARNARMYRYNQNDSSNSYSNDSDSPLNFYAALATNCTDFWQMAQSEWYSNISKAADILTGKAVDESGKLHSTEYYVNTVAKSASLNDFRLDTNSKGDFDAEKVTSDINNWLTERQTWINGQFSQTYNIVNCDFETIEDQECTGSPLTPKTTLKYNGAVLREGIDYDVEYSNNTRVGTAGITFTGKGIYTGSVNRNFNIVSGSLDGSATIDEAAYAGDTLSVNLTNANGDELSSFVNYQWYVDGAAVSGATDSTYTVAQSDAGKTITVVVSGDSANLSGSLTSNSCSVRTGEKPTNFAETLASWNYDADVDENTLTNSDTTGNSYYYTALDGQLAEDAKLSASINAVDSAKIEWSADYYTNSSTLYSSAYTPVMEASKKKNIPWDEYPYFETTIPTTGYENITFSAKLGGTKKGPANWKLQYSTDGVNYTDIEGATYSIIKNKTMEQAFDKAQLPAECSNVRELHIRVVSSDDTRIGRDIYSYLGTLDGEAAINNIEITGTRLSVITSLEAPTLTCSSENGDGTALFDTDRVTLKDNNGGADVYYSVGGTETLYTGPFSPFDENAKIGDSVTVTAYSRFNDIVSDSVSASYTYIGSDISDFSFDTYSDNVSGGALFSSGGAYDKSAKMTAYTDGNSQYVPLWNEDNGAFAVSPDDGAKWSAVSGFTFELSTAGYENVNFTAKAYTTAQGPNSLTLQYSLDGGTWYTVESNKALAANKVLEQYYLAFDLPSACDDKNKLFLRLVTSENLTNGGVALHNNASKGNLYINDVIIAGEQNGEVKKPYTNKTSDFFGDTGNLKYYSIDGDDMRYTVVDPDSNIILSGSYNSETGIVIQDSALFNETVSGPYTVSVWNADDDEREAVNTRQYYYKGDTIVEFDYSSSKRPLENYLNGAGTVAENTAGAKSGTLSMYPDGVTPTVMSSSDTYGVKVSWATDNIFTATKNLDNPNGNGFWLITTSTLGYESLSLNVEQLSSNKGPRDWGIAYSTDGVNYTYVPNSNARAISNDASSSTVETYNNFALPSACDNQETLYIKVFINGGESVDGNELDDRVAVTKGNTGIDNIALSGIEIPGDVTVSVSTVMLERAGDTSGTYPVDTVITVNGTEYQTTNGTADITLKYGKTYTAYASVSGTFVNTFRFTARDDTEVTVPVVALDINGDGIINGRDIAYIHSFEDNTKKEKYKTSFQRFAGTLSSEFTY